MDLRPSSLSDDSHLRQLFWAAAAWGAPNVMGGSEKKKDSKRIVSFIVTSKTGLQPNSDGLHLVVSC